MNQDVLESLWIQKLYREFQEACQYYRVRLDLPLISLSHDKNRMGSYDHLTRRLCISSHLIQHHSWDVVIEILKHEMAHAVVATLYSGVTEAHGPEFREACQRLGVAPWAQQAQVEIDPVTAMQAHRQLSAEQERLLRRVEKLLSLAGSSEAHEAGLAMERARELMVRHQLESHRDQTVHTYTYLLIEHKKKQIPSHQSAIASILGSHFAVECVERRLYYAQEQEEYKVLEIIGTRENVQMAEYVYWFLWNQLPLLWSAHRTHTPSGSTRMSQRSFYLGVLNGFHEKLNRQKEQLQQSAQEWGLELSQRQQQLLTRKAERELRDFIRTRYPSLQSRGRQGRDLDYDNFTSGQQQGRQLNLHRGLEQRGPSGQYLDSGRK